MPRPENTLNPYAIVVITGGSSGIGAALIKSIRKLNPQVALCNLSRSKPTDFETDLDHHIGCDLTDPAQRARAADRVMEQVAACGPGRVLLINNSGFGDYAALDRADRSKQLTMIDLNITAVVDLTLRLLPALTDRGGLVVTISSTASFQPTPYMATYGATKAFVTSWTLALNEDLRDTPAGALVICPGPTESNFFAAAGFEEPPPSSGLGLTAAAVADQILEAISRGKALWVTGWKNRMLVAVSSRLPKTWIAAIGRRVLHRFRVQPGNKG